MYLAPQRHRRNPSVRVREAYLAYQAPSSVNGDALISAKATVVSMSATMSSYEDAILPFAKQGAEKRTRERDTHTHTHVTYIYIHTYTRRVKARDDDLPLMRLMAAHDAARVLASPSSCSHTVVATSSRQVGPHARRKHHHATRNGHRCIIYVVHTSPIPRRVAIAPLLARAPLLAGDPRRFRRRRSRARGGWSRSSGLALATGTIDEAVLAEEIPDRLGQLAYGRHDATRIAKQTRDTAAAFRSAD